MSETQFHLLKTRRFLPLLCAQALSAFNDNLLKNALVILVAFGGMSVAGVKAEHLVSIAAATFVLPFFLFSATAGQLADRLSRSTLLKWVKFAEIVLAVIAAGGLLTGNAILVLTMLFLMGVQAAFLGPVKYGILPDLLRENELIGGNALVEASTFAAILAGTIAGGLLILGPDGRMVVSVGLIAAATLGWLVSLATPATPAAAPGLRINPNPVAETWNILKISRRDLPSFRSITGISWFWFLGSTFLIVFPSYVKDVIGGTNAVVTLLLATFSIGIVLGSLLCNRLTKGQVTDILVPFGALGLTLFATDLFFASRAALAVKPEIALSVAGFLGTFEGKRILIDFMLLAISGGLYVVPLYAIIQKRAKEDERARMIAANNILNAIGMVAASAMVSTLLGFGLPLPSIFLVVAAINVPVAIYIARVVIASLAKKLRDHMGS